MSSHPRLPLLLRTTLLGLATGGRSSAGFAALSWTSGRHDPAPLNLLAGVAGMQFAGVRISLHRWWIPPKGGLRGAWGALSSWSAWPPLAIQIIVVLTAAAAVAVVVSVVKRCRDAPETGLRPPLTARHSLG